MPDQLVTVTQAAALLGVHRTRIGQMIKAGRLKAITLQPVGRLKGRKLYLLQADIERLACDRGPRREPEPQKDTSKLDAENQR
jgi:excisionase family DNA binding protein